MPAGRNGEAARAAGERVAARERERAGALLRQTALASERGGDADIETIAVNEGPAGADCHVADLEVLQKVALAAEGTQDATVKVDLSVPDSPIDKVGFQNPTRTRGAINIQGARAGRIGSQRHPRTGFGRNQTAVPHRHDAPRTSHNKLIVRVRERRMGSGNVERAVPSVLDITQEKRSRHPKRPIDNLQSPISQVTQKEPPRLSLVSGGDLSNSPIANRDIVGRIRHAGCPIRAGEPVAGAALPKIDLSRSLLRQDSEEQADEPGGKAGGFFHEWRK